jgi:hypothetical protein
MDDTKLKVMWIGRFYFRWYAARALAPLMILTG